MKKLLIILLSALSLTVVAQQKKVAVYVTGEQSGVSKVLGDKLVEAFANNGKYIAVERTASFLSELGKEQGYQRTGAVSDNEISRLGKQFGVQYVCVADVSEVFGEKYVSARLIEVESAEVIKATNANSTMSSMNDLLALANKITSEFTVPTAQEKAQAEEKAAREKRENRIKQTLANGYIHVGSYYVTFPAIAREEWKSAINRQKNCRIGGWSDWRFPTKTEIQSIVDKCGYSFASEDDFYVELNYLKKSARAGLDQLTKERVWLENGDIWYGYFATYRAKDANVILIRDAWK